MNPVILNEVKDILFQRLFAHSQNDDAWRDGCLSDQLSVGLGRLRCLRGRSTDAQRPGERYCPR